MNATVKERRQTSHGHIPIDRNLQLVVILFAADLALLASTEDVIQRSIQNFRIVASKYNMEISIQKTKVMTFGGKDPILSKICLNNKKGEGTNNFIYLGYKLSFQGELDLQQKIKKYTKNYGYHKRGFKNNIIAETRQNTSV
jgi:hypothetical protein